MVLLGGMVSSSPRRDARASSLSSLARRGCAAENKVAGAVAYSRGSGGAAEVCRHASSFCALESLKKRDAHHGGAANQEVCMKRMSFMVLTGARWRNNRPCRAELRILRWRQRRVEWGCSPSKMTYRYGTRCAGERQTCPQGESVVSPPAVAPVAGAVCRG